MSISSSRAATSSASNCSTRSASVLRISSNESLKTNPSNSSSKRHAAASPAAKTANADTESTISFMRRYSCCTKSIFKESLPSASISSISFFNSSRAQTIVVMTSRKMSPSRLTPLPVARATTSFVSQVWPGFERHASRLATRRRFSSMKLWGDKRPSGANSKLVSSITSSMISPSSIDTSTSTKLRLFPIATACCTCCSAAPPIIL
mmetsp:Transcript_17672/g.37119  ORF Transcript_17672/g.37119 Transcript_17672/m.37119 type:complete len:207 (-) Transcript_17672:1693-2313(-)